MMNGRRPGARSPRTLLRSTSAAGDYYAGAIEKEKLRVAVYGGSFDPITNAHLTCISEIIHSGSVDEVWIVPCGPRPDKPSLRTSALERLIMSVLFRGGSGCSRQCSALL